MTGTTLGRPSPPASFTKAASSAASVDLQAQIHHPQIRPVSEGPVQAGEWEEAAPAEWGVVAAVHVLEAEAVVGVGAHGQHEALSAQQRQERHEVRPVDAILTTTTTAAQRRASWTAIQTPPSPPVLIHVFSHWEESHLVELVWGPVGRGHHDDATRPQLAK
jgi:hypothetical protein